MININNKEWDKLTASDIVEFLDTLEDETFFFELKSDAESNEKLMKEISAFANTYGGYIFLGIENDKTISGCQKWTEERVHTTMHDSISPIPNFDVKKFSIDEKAVLVIKIEEGAFPPYITNKGLICERVSSGSYTIKDSAKLTQLYNKRSDQLKKIHNKIDIEEIRVDRYLLPNNLCAYIDFGFSLVTSKPTHFQENFRTMNLDYIADYLKKHVSKYSFSRYGYSLVFSVGDVSIIGENKNNLLLGAGIDNFVEIFADGSVKGRLLLVSKEDTNVVDISSFCIKNTFKEIYSLLIGENLADIFISAYQYEKVTVIKKFKPAYGVYDPDEKLAKFSSDQKKKYGEILITNNNRVPKNDFIYLDKRSFSESNLDYNTKNLLDELFASFFANLGFVDMFDLVK